ncbi:MAG: DNA/RNA non-specific endonuclease [Pseudomonadota bacterium]
MMQQDTIDSFAQRIKQSQAERKRTREYVQQGKWQDAEADEGRRRAYQAREEARLSKLNLAGREAVQGDTRDFQPVSFLEEGASVRRAIAKVEVNTMDTSDQGTGFLISPRLFLTNQHVVQSVAHARATAVIFDYETDEFGKRAKTSSFELDPDVFWLASPEAELDCALIALGTPIHEVASPTTFGYCPLSDSEDRHRVGMNVNVIQHPGGALKMIAVRNNLLTHRTQRTLLYETDTLKGSSGAPVFNDAWEVIALHHYGAPSDEADENGDPIPREINEGIRVSQIYRFLESAADAMPAHQRALADEALSLFEAYRAQGPTVTRGRPVREPEQLRRQTSRRPNRDESNMEKNTGMSFVVPLEITVTPPAGCYPAGGAARPYSDSANRPQLSSAEGKRLDRDYSNRNGFDPEFVDGLDINLAAVVAPLADRVTPLKDNQPNHERGVLDYQNFSVIMDSEHLFALVTATNIDGGQYKPVDRASGEVREGESWYIERRIDRDAFVDQNFYSGWSHIFDRGHLTRRNDPTWGSKTEAERANADTFHFTNCSPQQWRFNQTIEFWQGIERYVLEEGLSGDQGNKHLTVLQGPVYTDAAGIDDPIFADDVRIPTAFWKLVVWRSGNEHKAVALIASQSALLDEFRGFGGGSDDDVSVEEFRVSTRDLEDRTGLDFSQFHAFDTIAAGGAPRVGEAVRRLRAWRDIELR